CIDLYQGRLRDWFEAALARGGRYLPRIREVFKEEGLPQDLAYLALVESAFHTNALSRAQAKGMWQFISETGRRYGLNQDWWVDDRADPEKATRAPASARYSSRWTATTSPTSGRSPGRARSGPRPRTTYR